MEKNLDMDVLEGEKCPFCLKDTLTLRQMERDVPYFGILVIFSMQCQNEDCSYMKSDVEFENSKDPIKCTFQIESEDDLKVRVVKSSSATIKLPRIGAIEGSDSSNGYVTNIEGILNRMKTQIENVRDNAEDPKDRKKAKNIVKKLTNILWGRESLNITLEDPNGNSAIISDKTKFK